MNREEILQAYKEGSLSTHEVLDLLRSQKLNNRTALSVGQEGLWVLQRTFEEDASYNIPLCFRILQSLDFDRFKGACEFLLHQHSILKTIVNVADDGLPFQTIRDSASIDLYQEDVSALGEEEIIALLRKRGKKAFRMTESLFRVDIFSKSFDEHYVLIVVHHLIFDATSLHLLLKTLIDAYLALLRGEMPYLSQPTATYADFVEWEKAMLSSEEGQSYKTYWERQLVGDLPILNVPKDHPRTSKTEPVGSTYVCEIPQSLAKRVKIITSSLGITPAVLFLSIYSLLLHRYTDERDIIVGMPTVGRPQSRFYAVIGYFVNVIALRTSVDSHQKFADFVKILQGTMADGLDNAVYPFASVVRDLKVPRQTNEAPIFQVAYEYQNASVLALRSAPSGAKFKMESVEGIYQEGEYELVLEILELDSALEMHMKYDASLYESITIKKMVAHYINILSQVLDDPHAQLSAYSLLSSSEISKVKEEWNPVKTDYPKDKSLSELISEQARRTPEATAIVFEGKGISYLQLEERTNHLSLSLRSLGVKSGTLVGVYLERSLELPISLIGVMKSGAAYVPLDPTFPQERLNYMFRDSRLEFLITHSSLVSNVKQFADDNVRIICIDEISSEIILAEAIYLDTKRDSVNAQAEESALAYIMYTSGSTGHPKGVMVSHQSLVNFLVSMSNCPGLDSNDRLLAITTYSFDISGLELYLPLLVGATCYICSSEKVKNVELLKQEIENVSPTVMQATPTTWSMLLHIGWHNEENLKILCGGEALPANIKERFVIENWEVWNLYGPTETTIWSTIDKVRDVNGYSIGRPISNTEVYILDEYLQLRPALVPGEIYIGGDGLALGYYDQKTMTAEKFIDNPYSYGDKIYKTGDLGYWCVDGAIEYIGRIDSQIKLRGYRIELGEIEAQLCRHPQIKDAVVIESEVLPGQRQLVAYIVSGEKTEHDSEHQKQVGFSLFYFGAEEESKEIIRNKYDLYLKAAKFADDHGFEAIWSPERHFDPVGGLYPSPSILAAAVATITKQVKLRAGSVVLPLHHPVQIAEEWSVVDNLSNGRVGVAIASGWVPRDFVTIPQNFGSRKSLVSDGISTLKKLWEGSPIVLADGNGDEVDIQLFPKPLQNELPIWLTSSGNPETFVEAGRLGTNVLTHLLGQSIDELAEKIKLYRKSLIEHGHNPNAGRVTVMVHTFLGENSQQTIDQAREPFIKYMKAHLGLLKTLVESVDMGTGNAEQDMEAVAAFAFERYVGGSSLIGAPKDAINVVKNLQDVGVDEIACLVDWIDSDLALGGLHWIHELQKISNNSPTVPDTVSGLSMSTKSLREYCSNFLPDYMVPARFERVQELPLTPNGKVDRKTIRKNDVKFYSKSNLHEETDTGRAQSAPLSAENQKLEGRLRGENQVPVKSPELTPLDKVTHAIRERTLSQENGSIQISMQKASNRGEIEQHIKAIWQQALASDEFGLDDNFFVVGGHSLAALTVADRIKSDFQCDFKITDIFAYSTIRKIAEYLSGDLAEKSKSTFKHEEVVEEV